MQRLRQDAPLVSTGQLPQRNGQLQGTAQLVGRVAGAAALSAPQAAQSSTLQMAQLEQLLPASSILTMVTSATSARVETGRLFGESLNMVAQCLEDALLETWGRLESTRDVVQDAVDTLDTLAERLSDVRASVNASEESAMDAVAVARETAETALSAAATAAQEAAQAAQTSASASSTAASASSTAQVATSKVDTLDATTATHSADLTALGDAVVQLQQEVDSTRSTVAQAEVDMLRSVQDALQSMWAYVDTVVSSVQDRLDALESADAAAPPEPPPPTSTLHDGAPTVTAQPFLEHVATSGSQVQARVLVAVLSGGEGAGYPALTAASLLKLPAGASAATVQYNPTPNTYTVAFNVPVGTPVQEGGPPWENATPGQWAPFLLN